MVLIFFYSSFKKIKDWLRLEAKTNEYLLDSCQDASSFEKKTDHSYSSNASLLKIKRGTRFFKWNSKRSMQLEYLIRFISFGTVLTVPMLIYWYLFDNQLNAWKGFFGYSTFIGIIFVITKQRHRIEHISGLQNPYHIGFFTSLFIYNYWTHYVYLMECKFNGIHLILGLEFGFICKNLILKVYKSFIAKFFKVLNVEVLFLPKKFICFKWRNIKIIFCSTLRNIFFSFIFKKQSKNK